MFYLWLFIVILLSIIEIMTLNLVSIWYIVSALITMILSLFINNIYIQVSVFVLGGTILLLMTRKIVNKIIPVMERTNIDRIIGMKGEVVKGIEKNQLGEVKVDGKIWLAKADENISEKEVVKILEINSTKLIVEKVKE